MRTCRFVTNTIQSVVSESFPIEVFEDPRSEEERGSRSKTRVSFGQVMPTLRTRIRWGLTWSAL